MYVTFLNFNVDPFVLKEKLIMTIYLLKNACGYIDICNRMCVLQNRDLNKCYSWNFYHKNVKCIKKECN